MTVSEREQPAAADSPGTATAPRLPGDIHMWVMVLGDLFFFGCYFVTYMVFRARSAEEFAAGQQQLSMGIGVTNTVVLLTSSMFIALAVNEVRHGSAAGALRLVSLTGVCGVLFIALKAYEWHHLLDNGHTVAEEFFSFYYVLTGVHAAHLALGLLILGIVVGHLRRGRAGAVSLSEQGALYWHMIDLLWIVIFAILYLMR